MLGLGFRDYLRFRIWGVGFRNWGLGFVGVSGLGI